MTPVASALGKAFADADRPLLIGYLPAGYPTHDTAIDALKAMVDGGVDAIELGLPYSDSLMDGPVVQDALTQALANGSTTAAALRTVEIIAATGTPTVVMSSWNLVEQHGVAAFARDLAAAGGSGIVTPDLVPEEADEWLAAAGAHGLDPIFLVAPTSTDARVRLVADVSRGFIYAASTMGVTGVRAATSDRAPALVARVRAVVDTPVCVGLGVSNGEQAAEVASYADGVIVGSALVRALREDGPSGVHGLTRDLATGVRSARRT